MQQTELDRRNMRFTFATWVCIFMLLGMLSRANGGPLARLLGESIALTAFGVAWIASGKTFRFIADEDEIYHPFRRS